MENMTALVSAFARAYHYEHCAVRVFSDAPARKLMTEAEYAAISDHMARGVEFFLPGFEGTREAALRRIVEGQLAPAVLARSAFCARAFDNAARLGCGQAVLYAAGYDTFALRTRRRALTVFELDRPEMIADKRARVALSGIAPACRVAYVGCDLSDPDWREALLRAGYHRDQPAFGSLLGISYYLTKAEFARLIEGIASISCEGAAVCLDYPLDEDAAGGLTRALAAAAGEPMRARYAEGEMEALLSAAGFLVCEHLNAREADAAFFADYNRANPAHPMTAPAGVAYCLAVRK